MQLVVMACIASRACCLKLNKTVSMRCRFSEQLFKTNITTNIELILALVFNSKRRKS